MKPTFARRLAQCALIALSTMIPFTGLNVIALYAWEVYSANNTNPLTQHPVRQNLSDLDDHELDLLFTQTWQPGWQYAPWVGFTEAPRTGEYVTVYAEGFRRTVGSSNLLENSRRAKKLFFFGGSTTFGYNVADQHTIASYFQYLVPQYDVFNFGRGYYYSKQENILLMDLLERGHRPDVAVFIDGLNERCNGHPYQDELPYIFSLAHNQRGERAADWIILALSQLPVVRAINKIIVGWPQANYTNSNCTIETLKDMWKSRLRIRASLCQAFDIKCFSFLQPLAGVHGKHDDFGSLDQVGRSRLSDVYQGLRSLDDEDWFDISDSLNDLPYHGYVDNVHYSPAANQRIAGAVARMIASQVDKPNEVAQSQALPRFSPVAASD